MQSVLSTLEIKKVKKEGKSDFFISSFGGVSVQLAEALRRTIEEKKTIFFFLKIKTIFHILGNVVTKIRIRVDIFLSLLM
jgi:hypothetical protein